MWWLKILLIMDKEELCEELDELVLEEDPKEFILKEMGIKDIDELDESDRDLQSLGCWLSKTIFFLPISDKGLKSGDKPLLLREERDLEEIIQPLTEGDDFRIAFVELPTIHGF